MKKVLFAIGLMAAMVAVSCNKQLSTEVPGEPEYYEVKLGLGGAITTEITELTKGEEADNNLLIGIDVSRSPIGKNEYTPYAYGLFDANDITIKLVSGYKYKFTARSASEGKTACGNYDGTLFGGPFGLMSQSGTKSIEVKNEFILDPNYSFGYCYHYSPVDLFYGWYNDYVPSSNGSVSIDMNRVSFGLDIKVKNLTGGYVTIKADGFQNYIKLYPDNPNMSSIYALRYFHYTQRESDYAESIDISVDLTDNDNQTYSLGGAKVYVKPNKRTTITIDASTPPSENGVSFNYSETPMSDDETTYEIGGDGSEDVDIDVDPGTTTRNANGHEFVDLGLSINWATCNVGATIPEGYGDYFAWGDPETYYEASSTLPSNLVWKEGKSDGYHWNNYKYGELGAMTKYGTVDGKTVLDASDDAARVNWGGDWRMPSIAEIEELLSNCTWTWTKKNEINGYEVVGANGNSIFLPAAADALQTEIAPGNSGNYWSNSIYNGENNNAANYLLFHSGGKECYHRDRYYGMPVRAVIE